MLQTWVTAGQLSFLATLFRASYLTFYLEFVGHNAFSVMVAEKREATLLPDVFFFFFCHDKDARSSVGNTKSAHCHPYLGLYARLGVQTHRVMSTLSRKECPQEVLGDTL